MTTQKTTVTFPEIEMMNADLVAGELIFRKNNIERNPYMMCISAYYFAQSIEKGLKAIVKAESAARPGVINADVLNNIKESHDIMALWNAANKYRPDLRTKYPFIDHNKGKLNRLNNLRFGKRSILVMEVLALSDKAKLFVGDLEKEYLAENPNEKKNAQIAYDNWIKRPEADLRLPKLKSIDAQKNSISGDPISQIDSDRIRAAISAADILFEEYREKGDRNILCLAAFQYAELADRSLKAIICTDRSDLFNKVNDEGKTIYSITHDINKLLTKSEICRPGLIAKYAYLAENSDTLQHSSNLRYGQWSIKEEQVRSLATVVKALANELLGDFDQANPNQRENQRNRAREWKKLDPLDLSDIYPNGGSSNYRQHNAGSSGGSRQVRPHKYDSKGNSSI